MAYSKFKIIYLTPIASKLCEHGKKIVSSIYVPNFIFNKTQLLDKLTENRWDNTKEKGRGIKLFQ